MSRVDEGDEEEFPNAWAFWERRTRQVLAGKRGKKLLAELREALLALPEKRLVSGALSTAGKTDFEHDRWGEQKALLEREGEGVCAVGAFIWYQRVKAGQDPREAMTSLPLLPDYNGDGFETVNAGMSAGLGITLAWDLMARNDETFKSVTPEERYVAYLAWLDEQLAAA